VTLDGSDAQGRGGGGERERGCRVGANGALTRLIDRTTLPLPLAAVVPSASRFVVLTGRRGPFSEIRRDLEIAAQRLGVTLSFSGIAGPDDIGAALAQARKDGADGVIVPLDVITSMHGNSSRASRCSTGCRASTGTGITWRPAVSCRTASAPWRSVGAQRTSWTRSSGGGQARRPPHRATHEVRVSRQSQDRQGPRLDDPAVDPGAGGRNHPVIERGTFSSEFALGVPLCRRPRSGW